MKTLRLGTRGSKLALWQAEYTAAQLKQQNPDLMVEIKIIKTTGDKVLDVALAQIGDKGLFTKELESELMLENIDLAVHSLKDMPAELESGLTIGAVLKRENPVDVLLSARNYTFKDLPYGAVVGTSSLRRRAQILAVRPDLQIVDIRGNVETRIRKMQEHDFDGIILAYAGVKRLGLEEYISDFLTHEVMMPAVGQGIIAVEIREAADEVKKIISSVNDYATQIAVLAERSFLTAIQGGCQVPVAANAQLLDDQLEIRGLIASLDGKTILKDYRRGKAAEAEKIGRELASFLLQAGGAAILDNIRSAGAR
ncbi:MAG TPA: hydroxymethylbilane synthase [Syntrophomonadaceae bacterium]|nr:hydroxymethylbilane synthase [Syntrophomonadaceae bacterium]HPR93611.1 hydroxymethylbilane synthase [Syntrophomonadaceae bacterium]